MRKHHLTSLFLAALLIFPSQLAQANEAGASQRFIIVEGVGETSAAPDAASMSFTVVTQADTASGALRENSARTTEMIAALREMGLEDKDIATRNISVSPRYSNQMRSGEDEPRIIGYQAQNQIIARFVTLDDLGSKIDRAVELGANQIHGPDFFITDPKELASEARRKAVADALEKANIFATAGGFEIGEILELRETMAQIGYDRSPMMRMAAVAEAMPVPIEAGSQNVTAHITVKFAIK